MHHHRLPPLIERHIERHQQTEQQNPQRFQIANSLPVESDGHQYKTAPGQKKEFPVGEDMQIEIFAMSEPTL